jgi:anaerobic magnesium-protoporphyrin IX monomethyl ester cyclase
MEGRRVWFHEIRNFLFRDRRVADGPTLQEFWGAPQDREEQALTGPVPAEPRQARSQTRRGLEVN